MGKPEKTIDTVIFDMDGTLFDTERIYRGAWLEAGGPLSLYQTFIGTGAAYIEQRLAEHGLDPGEITAEKTRITNRELAKGIPLKPGHGHQVHVIGRHLKELGNHGLDEHGGHRRIQTGGKIIQRHLHDVLTHLLRLLRVVRQRLRIRNHNKNIIIFAGVLQFDSAAKGTDIMAHMKTARGAVSG